MENKIGFILDSFCSKNKNEIEEMGFGFLPLQLITDDKVYKIGFDIFASKETSALLQKDNVSTSQPTPDDIEKTFDLFSKKYENVIYIPTPQSLSATHNQAANIAKKYENVHVVENKFAGNIYVNIAKNITEHYSDKPIDEIIEIVKKYSIEDTLTFIFPTTINNLVKHGRVKGLSKIILSAMNWKPILQLKTHSKLKPVMLKRKINIACKYVVNKIIKEFSLNEKNINEWEFEIQYCFNDGKLAEMAEALIRNSFPNAKIMFAITSPLVELHVGSGLGISIYKKKI